MFERAADGYAWPKFGHQAELRSLSWHARQRDGLRSDAPVGLEKQAILSQMDTLFRHAKWSIPDDFMCKTHFERVLGRLDWTSSPGYPYMKHAPTNGDLFRVKNGVPDPERVEYYWQVVQQQISDGTADPIRLFVKGEPHKKKKLAQGRYRLISSVSVVDQIIDHMLFADMNDKLVEEHMFVPSKAGWAAYGGGWRAIPRENWLAIDKSSWDWTVLGWLNEITLEIRCRLCNNLSEKWYELALWRYRMLFISPIFVTSGGLLLRQRNPGVMKSGCVNTISDNSLMQIIIHLRVCFMMGIDPGQIYSMGDDTLQEPLERMGEYLDNISQFSIVKECKSENEFAGFRFRRGVIDPLYRGKHAFNLLHLNEEFLEQIAESYVLQYHRSVHRDLMEDLFQQMGLKLRSRDERDAIYDD